MPCCSGALHWDGGIFATRVSSPATRLLLLWECYGGCQPAWVWLALDSLVAPLPSLPPSHSNTSDETNTRQLRECYSCGSWKAEKERWRMTDFFSRINTFTKIRKERKNESQIVLNSCNVLSVSQNIGKKKRVREEKKLKLAHKYKMLDDRNTHNNHAVIVELMNHKKQNSH